MSESGENKSQHVAGRNSTPLEAQWRTTGAVSHSEIYAVDTSQALADSLRISGANILICFGSGPTHLFWVWCILVCRPHLTIIICRTAVWGTGAVRNVKHVLSLSCIFGSFGVVDRFLIVVGVLVGSSITFLPLLEQIIRTFATLTNLCSMCADKHVTVSRYWSILCKILRRKIHIGDCLAGRTASTPKNASDSHTMLLRSCTLLAGIPAPGRCLASTFDQAANARRPSAQCSSCSSAHHEEYITHLSSRAIRACNAGTNAPCNAEEASVLRSCLFQPARCRQFLAPWRGGGLATTLGHVAIAEVITATWVSPNHEKCSSSARCAGLHAWVEICDAEG